MKQRVLKREQIAVKRDQDIIGLAQNQDEDFFDINQSLVTKKNELEELYSHQAKGAYIRAKAR